MQNPPSPAWHNTEVYDSKTRMDFFLLPKTQKPKLETELPIKKINDNPTPKAKGIVYQ